MTKPLLSAEGMAERDRHVIDRVGVPVEVLIEAAATACLGVVLSAFPDDLGRGVVIVAGPGHNGADGIALARRLRLRGLDVELCVVGPQPEGAGAALLDQARRADVRICTAPDLEGLAFATARWGRAGVVVDALFGTGLRRPLMAVFAGAVEAIAHARRQGAAVLAIDVPSGIDATTGLAAGPYVVADHCVTFSAARIGHVQEPGRGARGKLWVADIGVPWVGGDGARLYDADTVRNSVAAPAADAHKGTRGKVLVVGGSPETRGAVVLAAMGCLGAGAGLVRVATPLLPGQAVPSLPVEAMVLPLPCGADGVLTNQAVELVLARAEGVDAVVVGPGLGLSAAARTLVLAMWRGLRAPAVLDADALTLLAAGPRPLDAPLGPRVLTPHPGEMGRFIGKGADDVQRHRIAVARALAAEAGATVVLKGPGTLVADPRGALAVVGTGGPALASGGTGDVLAGVIGALLARGEAPFEAAALGAAWHGLAGDLCAGARGPFGVAASEVARALGPALLGPPVPPLYTAWPG